MLHNQVPECSRTQLATGTANDVLESEVGYVEFKVADSLVSGRIFGAVFEKRGATNQCEILYC